MAKARRAPDTSCSLPPSAACPPARPWPPTPACARPRSRSSGITTSRPRPHCAPPAADPGARFLLGRAYAGNAAAAARAGAAPRSPPASATSESSPPSAAAMAARMAALYYGEYLLEAGKTQAGAAQLRRFIGAGAAPARYRELAELRLAVSQGSRTAALAGAKAADPLLRSQAAAALALSDPTRAQAVTIIDGVLAAVREPQ
ncbi:MAG: hypothetical protein MZV65_12490 [Chromatiales bacterium]|nr:hypothetical protein [Chromatiales bacterium]